MSAGLAETPGLAVPAPRLTQLRAAASEDLLGLALLHDRELDRELIHALWHDCYEDFLGLRLLGQSAMRALSLLREGLTEIPTELCQATLDRLAADYADIYLSYALRAAPCESVWLDEDNLALQEPNFQVRAWYRRYGLAVTDWRKRSDDHLVYELRFLARLLGGDWDGESVDLTEAARFMDQHPLRWVPQFAERVAQRCDTRFYAGLALLTAAYLDELRDLLTELTGISRPTSQEPEAALLGSPPFPGEMEGPYFPGVAPSW